MTSRLDQSEALGCVRDVASANSMYAYRDRLAVPMNHLIETIANTADAARVQQGGKLPATARLVFAPKGGQYLEPHQNPPHPNQKAPWNG